MDERLEKAIEFSNYMVTLNNQIRLLKEKYNQDLIYYFGGGQFTASREMVNFCNNLLAIQQDSVVVIDDKQIPILVENLEDFADDINNTYFTATNNYLLEYNSLKKTRSTEGLFNL